MVTSSGDKICIYFTLLLILGDNLGLKFYFRFNESFQSNYFCRFCKIHKNEAKHQVVGDEEDSRNVDNYDNDYLSLSYGVKEKCIWHELPNFHKIF